MSSLKLLLLGSPRLERDGVPVEFDTRKNVALVAYLAATAETHTRDALVALLWPELEPSRARAGLRRNLSVLKKALTGEWLVVERDAVGTNPNADLWLDVSQFRALLQSCQEHGHSQAEVCPDCLSALSEAVKLYRGDFMAGFGLRDSVNFDEWQFFQTESLRQELASALEALARGHSAQGEHQAAIPYARRWLALDPLHEPARRCLMRLYAWSGQRTAALRQYAECRRVLQEQLGAPPEEKTTRLYQAIKERQDLPPPGERGAKPISPQTAAPHDRYRLDAELGQGGTSVVYRAYDTLLERDVAIKVMSAMALDSEGRARLLREAQSAAALNHPNIVTVHDVGETDGAPFIVMELVEGASLHTHRPQDLDEITSIACQICAALEHAHSHGIVHRDLKPENVLLSPTPPTGTGPLTGINPLAGMNPQTRTNSTTVKLVDFGLARSVASRLTSEGTIIGTAFYLAPELALGQEFDGRADLYALGVILYELTTGRLPFTADDPLAVISQHLHAPVVPPRARNPEIPSVLNSLILRLLSKNPQHRPASATEVLGVLRQPDFMEKDVVTTTELSVLERIERGRLVGRERELWEARNLWNRTLSGQGKMLLISGEAGIGKTRLVRELITQVQVLGGQALVGASYVEGGTPYAAFRQIIRQALRGSDEKGFELPDFVLADLFTLAAELRSRFPDAPINPPLDPQAEQQRLFEHLVIFFTVFSDRAPLLLVLEDIHWADSGTLALLRHLARHTRQRRVMLVATHRQVGLDKARHLHEMLLDLNRERLAIALRLPRLDSEQTQEMLTVLFAEEITPEFLDGIYRETEGNPFFVEEVCKALVESGKLYYEGGRWHRPSMAELGIPQSTRVAIQSRVRVLPAASQETLRLAAVLGREFDFDILAGASDQEEDTLIEALEDAERAQLIEDVSREDEETFAFVHALIPATLVESTRTLKRRRLHLRAATAIEARRPDDFEALARHYNQAGKTEKAASYLLKAGDRARGLYAHQEAIVSYQQALEFLKGADDLEQAARTLMKLGLTHHNAFDFQAARQAYEEGFVFWQRVGETLREPADLLAPAPHALRVAFAEPSTLDPCLVMDTPSVIVAEQLFSGLTEQSPEMGVVPNVAHSWDVLDAGLKYVFHLRDDVRWSDGVPVTAGDFEYTWQQILAPASPWPLPYFLYDIRGARAFHEGEATDPEQVGVRAPDESTLVVELERPVSYFPHLLTYFPTLPVPRHVVQAHGAAWTELNNIVTNGPFRLTAWERGESMVLERNPTYHGRFTGNLERVECSLLSGQPTRELQMYDKDGLDVLFALPPPEMDRARQRHAGEYVLRPRLSTVFVGFDVTRPPFDDRRVRRAFSLATDKKTLANVILRGYAFPATGGLVPPGMPGHSPDIGPPYDLKGARHLLAEAGYADGRGFPPIDCLARDDPGLDLLCEYMQAQWQRNLGVEMTWKQIGGSKVVAKLYEEKPRLWMADYLMDYPDPDNPLRCTLSLFNPDWQNKAYDDLLERARRVTDQEKRIKRYQQADKALVEEAPIVPLCYGRFHILVKPWVRKFLTSPMKAWFWKDVVIDPHEPL